MFVLMGSAAYVGYTHAYTQLLRTSQSSRRVAWKLCKRSLVITLLIWLLSMAIFSVFLSMGAFIMSLFDSGAKESFVIMFGASVELIFMIFLMGAFMTITKGGLLFAAILYWAFFSLLYFQRARIL
jgi:hypothetical protein